MSSPTVAVVTDWLKSFAPLELAESWDNVGLLVGSLSCEVSRVMTCLTITPASLREAVARNVDLIVTHHPLPFRPVARLTDSTTTGEQLLKLAEHRIAVYSPHTAFDSTIGGINEQLAAGLGLTNVTPLLVRTDGVGTGRMGREPGNITLGELIDRTKSFLKIEQLQFVGDLKRSITKVAIACGSGGDFLAAAADAGCDCLLTGEARFHDCLEAEARPMALVLAGHFATERFALVTLADALQRQFTSLEVWASCEERDPLRTG